MKRKHPKFGPVQFVDICPYHDGKGGGFISSAVYIKLPHGLKIIGNGTLQNPLDVRGLDKLLERLDRLERIMEQF